jgi:uncharacterized membrane protein YedE/YeeE
MRDIAVMVSAALFGLLFGLGLIASQMSDPARIIGFLDVAGDWDPSLILVMLAAAVVAAPAFALARGSMHPLLADRFHLPPDRLRLDSPLLVGSAIFGVGWGLAGLCPGPALVLLGTYDTGALIFVPAAIIGALVARLRQQPQLAPSS